MWSICDLCETARIHVCAATIQTRRETTFHSYLTPRDDPKKYEASAELLNELHTTGRLPTSEIASQIQDAIRWLRDDNLQVVLAKDTAAQVKADFKWNSGRDIRDYERMLTLIEAVAWLHAFQRGRTDTGAVIADNRDLEIVKGFSDELLKTTRTGTSAQVLDYYESSETLIGIRRDADV